MINVRERYFSNRKKTNENRAKPFDRWNGSIFKLTNISNLNAVSSFSHKITLFSSNEVWYWVKAKSKSSIRRFGFQTSHDFTVMLKTVGLVIAFPMEFINCIDFLMPFVAAQNSPFSQTLKIISFQTFYSYFLSTNSKRCFKCICAREKAPTFYNAASFPQNVLKWDCKKLNESNYTFQL